MHSKWTNRLLPVVVLLVFGFVLNPQSKRVTDNFFPDLPFESNTPAFQKKIGFTKYSEMMSFLEQLQKDHPDYVKLSFIGLSQKGKSIPLVRLSKPGAVNPVRVWLQGGLHGNEPASTEGMLHVISEIAKDPGLLDRLVIEVVPMANIDGYEVQNRYAANGLDLNRDQTKLMAIESQLLKRAFTHFNPEVAVDFHEYRPYRRDFVHFGRAGVTSRFDVMFLYSGNLNVPENLRNYANETFVQSAREALDRKGMKHHDYLTTHDHHGETQFTQGSLNARSSATSYALTNCVSSLIEVRGVGIGRTSFRRRVLSTVEVAKAYLNTAYENVDELRGQLKKAEQTAGDAIVISSRKVGADSLLFIDLDTYEEIEMNVTIRDAFHSSPKLSRTRPVAYALSAWHNKSYTLVQKMRLLGLQVEQLKTPGDYDVECYVPTYVKKESYKYEGVHRLDVKTKMVSQDSTLEAGTYLVYLNQKNANLAIELLEPEASNSFISNNLVTPVLGQSLPYCRIIKK